MVAKDNVGQDALVDVVFFKEVVRGLKPACYTIHAAGTGVQAVVQVTLTAEQLIVTPLMTFSVAVAALLEP